MLFYDITSVVLISSSLTFLFFSGNEIEWGIPGDIDLTGIEFKALVSGSHTICQDFV